MTSRHIADRHRNEKGRNSIKAVIQPFGMFPFNGAQAANAAGNGNANPRPVFLLQLQTTVLHSLLSGNQSKLSEAVQFARFLFVQMLLHPQIFHLCRQLHFVVANVKSGNLVNTAGSLAGRRKADLGSVAKGRHSAQAGYHNSSFFHI